MQMTHGLTAIAARVDHAPVPRRRDALLPRDRLREHPHLAQRLRLGHVIERRVMRARDDEHVHRRLRRYRVANPRYMGRVLAAANVTSCADLIAAWKAGKA